MIMTRGTASLQLLRTPWTLRPRRKIWRAKRTKAARVPQAVPNPGRRNSGSYAETAIAGKSSLSTGAYRNVGHGGRFGRQLQFVRGVHSRFPKSISDFSQYLPAHAGSALSFANVQQDSLSCPWFLNRRRKRHGFIRSLCRQRLLAHATFAGIRKYFDGGTTGSATAHGRRAAALAGVD